MSRPKTTDKELLDWIFSGPKKIEVSANMDGAGHLIKVILNEEGDLNCPCEDGRGALEVAKATEEFAKREGLL